MKTKVNVNHLTLSLLYLIKLLCHSISCIDIGPDLLELLETISDMGVRCFNHNVESVFNALQTNSFYLSITVLKSGAITSLINAGVFCCNRLLV